MNRSNQQIHQSILLLAAHCLFIMPQTLPWIPRSLCINLSCSSCLDSCRFFFDYCASTLAAHRLFFVPRRSSFVPRPSSFISHLYISASLTDASFFAGTCFLGAFPYFVASLALRRISCTPLYLLHHVASPTPFYIRLALSCIFLFLAGTIIDLSRTWDAFLVCLPFSAHWWPFSINVLTRLDCVNHFSGSINAKEEDDSIGDRDCRCGFEGIRQLGSCRSQYFDALSELSGLFGSLPSGSYLAQPSRRMFNGLGYVFGIINFPIV